jgi:hypothetical protein
MEDDTNKLIAGLRDLAKKAPAGPWMIGRSSGYGNPTVQTPDGPLFSTGNAKRPLADRRAACAFASVADPEMILTLCDVIERLQIERAALIAGIDKISEAAMGR